MKTYKLRVTDSGYYRDEMIEAVARNLHDSLDGKTVSEEDLPRLRSIMAELIEHRSVGFVKLFGGEDKGRLNVVMGGSEDDVSATIVTVEFEYKKDIEYSMMYDIKYELNQAGLLMEGKSRRERFYAGLEPGERDAAELLDAYFSTRLKVPELGGKALMEDFMTSMDIVDDVDNMIELQQPFVTRYMLANGFNATTIKDGTLRWQIWRIIPGAF